MSTASALPTGTVTFLFTDIEGSTKLWEAHPDAMQVALARHDALLQEVITNAGGVVFKTVGDAFCAAFADASAALEAVTKAQRAFFGEAWPEQTPLHVRMALHTGTAEERDGDYFGPVLNRVARLLSAGHGGQTLLSASTYELVRDHLAHDVTLLDLGSRRLKDLKRPEIIYQVNASGLPDTFERLRTLDNPDLPNNLPQQLTSFVGREKQIAEVTALLGQTRLVTLIGAGGAGKTRLSLQVAADVLDQYADGVWQIELAPLSDPSLVAQIVAQVLGIKGVAGQTITQTLVEQLNAKNVLIVLDNCEHLIGSCAKFTAALLQSCPQVKVMATSREPLGIAGETTYRVPSLSLPTPQASKKVTADILSQFEAVRLFIDRAQAVKQEFTVTNTNAPALAQLCYRLDGIPLAIELAAARARSLPVEQINERLDNRFRILTGGDRTALPRQQTLRSLVDWSYDLLTEPEKALFARLSIFAGGWSLESAERVCGWEPIQDWEVLDLLTSLADKSLVIAEEIEGQARYEMLETLRQYGAEKLTTSGAGAETSNMQIRHRNYFVALAEEAQPNLNGPESLKWLNLLETEHDNFRLALGTAANAEEDLRAADDARQAAREASLRLVGVLWYFWYVRGYFAEGRELMSRALDQGQSLPSLAPLRAKALNGAGNLAAGQGDQTVAQALFMESLELSRAQNDKSGIAAGLGNLGHIASAHGEYAKARSLYEESLEICRELGDTNRIALGLGSLSNVVRRQGDLPTAQLLSEESLALRRTLEDKRGIAMSLANLAGVFFAQDNPASARGLIEESLVLYRELGDKRGMAISLSNLGSIVSEQGDTGAASRIFRECLTSYRELGDKRGMVDNLTNLAFELINQSQFQTAAILFGAVEAEAQQSGVRAPLDEPSDYETAMMQLETALGSEAFAAACANGRALSLQDAVTLATRDTTQQTD